MLHRSNERSEMQRRKSSCSIRAMLLFARHRGGAVHAESSLRSSSLVANRGRSSIVASHLSRTLTFSIRSKELSVRILGRLNIELREGVSRKEAHERCRELSRAIAPVDSPR